MSVTIEVSFDWALPVDTAKLGAHLQAYQQALPAITALRLCNRFGQGEQAYVTKLSNELVKCIEQHLAADQRMTYLKQWQQRADCASRLWLCPDLQCMLDHLTSTELEELMVGLGIRCHFCKWAKKDNKAIIQKHGNEYDLEERLADNMMIHEARDMAKIDWRNSVMEGMLFREVVGKLLETQFGLKPWMVLERDEDPGEVETTKTYLVPSDSQLVSVTSEPNSIESDMGLWDLQTGIGMPVDLSARSVDNVRRRFRRALGTLGLTPLEILQKEDLTLPLLKKPSVSSRDAVDPAKSWPRLMVLSRMLNIHQDF